MKTFWISLGVIAISAGHVYADVSDSGNLNLGGQAIVVGTMTVNGNAFNVGGSTLAVTGGSVGIGTVSPATTLDVNGSAQFGSTAKSTFTASGLLKLTASGIQWADGSTSTTTANGSGATSTVIPFVSSMSVTSVVCSTFSVVVSSTQYTLNFNLRQVSTSISNSHFYIRFNGDNGSNYVYASFGYDTDFGTNANAGNPGAQIYLTAKGTGIGVDTNDPFNGTMTFATVPGVSKQVSGTSRQGWLGNGSTPFIAVKTSFFSYTGSSNLSSINVCVDAGKYSGWLYLYNQ